MIIAFIGSMHALHTPWQQPIAEACVKCVKICSHAKRMFQFNLSGLVCLIPMHQACCSMGMFDWISLYLKSVLAMAGAGCICFRSETERVYELSLMFKLYSAKGR